MQLKKMCQINILSRKTIYLNFLLRIVILHIFWAASNFQTKSYLYLGIKYQKFGKWFVQLLDFKNLTRNSKLLRPHCSKQVWCLCKLNQSIISSLCPTMTGISIFCPKIIRYFAVQINKYLIQMNYTFTRNIINFYHFQRKNDFD